MSNEIEIELLQERVDSLHVANEDLRERLAKTIEEMSAISERAQKLEDENRELSARVGRLQLHIQQGVEL